MTYKIGIDNILVLRELTPEEEIRYTQLQRFLCPVCQREWTGAKGASCEACYAKAWDENMARACAPVLIGTEKILCEGKACLEEVKEEGDLCPSCEADEAEYAKDMAEDRAYEMARDDHYMRKIDERRGK